MIDYSLLLGINEATGEIVTGLVDYCRGYGMREMAEKTYKGGRTVTNPQVYRVRFCNFVRRIFLASPCLPQGCTHRVE